VRIVMILHDRSIAKVDQDTADCSSHPNRPIDYPNSAARQLPIVAAAPFRTASWFEVARQEVRVIPS
jgi:hypothetical protein